MLSLGLPIIDLKPLTGVTQEKKVYVSERGNSLKLYVDCHGESFF